MLRRIRCCRRGTDDDGRHFDMYSQCHRDEAVSPRPMRGEERSRPASVLRCEIEEERERSPLRQPSVSSPPLSNEAGSSATERSLLPGPRSAVAEPEPDLRTKQTSASSMPDFPLIVQTLQPGWNLVGWSGATTGTDAFGFTRCAADRRGRPLRACTETLRMSSKTRGRG